MVTLNTIALKKSIKKSYLTVKKSRRYYLLGIMASKFISHLYIHNSTIATKNDFRQTTLAELRNIPIIIIPLSEQQSIADIAEEILITKKENPKADTTELEKQIDRLVYNLYGLTEEEVKIVEGEK